jgi:hypothetical protein
MILRAEGSTPFIILHFCLLQPKDSFYRAIHRGGDGKVLLALAGASVEIAKTQAAM